MYNSIYQAANQVNDIDEGIKWDNMLQIMGNFFSYQE